MVKHDIENFDSITTLTSLDPKSLNKQFDQQQLSECLQLTEEALAKQEEGLQKQQQRRIKENLEMALSLK